jgi:CYTH domain-containing protein
MSIILNNLLNLEPKIPTENELKFILNLASESSIKRMAEAKLLISQGYLLAGRGISLRFRKVKNYKKISFYMTFKTTVNGGGRTVEIEKKIGKRDFNDIWPFCLNKLDKIRYLIHNSDELWEIDYFKDYTNKTYFAMAEIEMPESKAYPNSLPNFIKNNLLFEVPLSDSRFSSKLLGNPSYATNIYCELNDKNRKK